MGVFVGGDFVFGFLIVIESIVIGRRVVIMIDFYFKGKFEKVREVLFEFEKYIEEVLNDEDFYRVFFDFRLYNYWKKVMEKDYEYVERRLRVKVEFFDLEVRK